MSKDYTFKEAEAVLLQLTRLESERSRWYDVIYKCRNDERGDVYPAVVEARDHIDRLKLEIDTLKLLPGFKIAEDFVVNGAHILGWYLE